MKDSEIEKLKKDIFLEYQKKIDELTAERDSELAAVDRLENRLKRLSTRIVDLSDSDSFKNAIRRTRFPNETTTYDRVKSAIINFSGQFTSREIWEKANNDGRGKEIIPNSFYSVFSKLLNDDDFGIVVIQERSGKKPGIYIRTQETTVK